jgi:hypothetical protein
MLYCNENVIINKTILFLIFAYLLIVQELNHVLLTIQ